MTGSPSAFARPDQRQRRRGGQVQDVRPAPGPPGRLEQPLDRAHLGSRRPGREEVGVAPPVRRRRGLDRRRRPRRARSAARRTTRSRPSPRPARPASSGANSATPEGEQEALEPEHPGVVQRPQLGRRCPARRRPRSRRRRGTWPRAAAPLTCQRGDVDRRRDAVQRHVDDRGDAARRGRPGGRGEPLPLGPAGLVDVHVGVHQPGQQHLVRRRSTVRAAGRSASGGSTAAIRPSRTATAAGTSPSGPIIRRARKTTSNGAVSSNGTSSRCSTKC